MRRREGYWGCPAAGNPPQPDARAVLAEDGALSRAHEGELMVAPELR